MPDWDSWFNEGAGVAIADISGNGQPDLLVFRVDAVPEGQNAGYYRMGGTSTQPVRLPAGRLGWQFRTGSLGSMPAPMSRLQMWMAMAFSTWSS